MVSHNSTVLLKSVTDVVQSVQDILTTYPEHPTSITITRPAKSGEFCVVTVTIGSLDDTETQTSSEEQPRT